MSRVRFQINGELVNLSPLHVGSGEAAKEHAVVGKSGEAPPEVAGVVRDVRDRPFIPGTTLKGLLRRCGETLFPAVDGEPSREVRELFGLIRSSEPAGPQASRSSGAIGALIVRGAEEIAAPEARGMPYSESTLGAGLFVAARTRVDRHTGTAADNSLHFAEMVAPGARFRLRLLLEPRRRGSDAEILLTQTVCVMAALCDPGGVAVGRGQADGLGRMQLDPDSVTIRRLTLNDQGCLQPADATVIWRQRQSAAVAPGQQLTLTLSCDGPFAILDSSHVRPKDEAGEPTGPQLKAQAHLGRPLVLGSSLSGALRARAAWQEARRRHRAGEQLADSRAIDDPSRVLDAQKSPDTLTAVERLFGVSGFRGQVDIVSLEVTKGTVAGFTSVKLDRFSGAPIDNALYETEAFIDTEIKVTLALAARPGLLVRDDDREVFKSLIDDIVANGLMLGHGGGKGFGWFSVKQN